MSDKTITKFYYCFLGVILNLFFQLFFPLYLHLLPQSLVLLFPLLALIFPIPIELKVGDVCLFNWKCAHYSENNYSNRSRMIFYATFCEKNKNKNLRKMYYRDKQNSYNSKKNKSLLFT